jgi:hypothetical protein
MESSAGSASKSSMAPAKRGARQRWFPVLVLACLVAWWIREAARTDYQSFLHVIAVLFSAVLLSLWYAACGGAKLRTRTAIVGISWLLVCTWFVVFKPVYNGAMGYYGWQYRFAPAADQLLTDALPAAEPSEAVDWQRRLARSGWRATRNRLAGPSAAGSVAAGDRGRLVRICGGRQLRRDAGAAGRA